jgi:MoxR-like ATPase
MAKSKIQRTPAEVLYKAELKALVSADQGPKPPNWKLSPKRVVDYIMGTQLKDGTKISPKYIGDRSLIEIAVATLTTDRALLLSGIPGTAKTWVSEHLAAAISGTSRLLVQGTAGTHEDKLLYGWNYPVLLSKGPVREALVPSPVMRAMEGGMIVRIEEMTRMPYEIQDALITILSERSMPIPELNEECFATEGFNVIATANDRDRGIHEMSGALTRRFNNVILPLPSSVEEELEIVTRRLSPHLLKASKKKVGKDSLEEIKKVIAIFRELREGRTEDGQTALKRVSSTLSTAEIIAVVNNALAMGTYFDDGTVKPKYLAGGLQGAIVKNKDTDMSAWREYVEIVMKKRKNWGELYDALTKIEKENHR